MDSFNRIEREVVLNSPIARVWQAIANAKEFGQWFGVTLDGDFEVGKQITGSLSHEIDEAKIIEYQEALGLTPSKVRIPDNGFVFCTPERMDPETYFSFRWIPYGIDAEADLNTEPTTLVEFRLEEVPEGTLLTISESGFENVPAHRRERAFRMNEGGWSGQADNIRKIVEVA